ncbi:MAG: nucleotidyltransferase domain-containing protein [Actinomycetia bacterium]|nr:nucleotidyltransferase domain-containing protein [Actinomycetota bacterium]MCG2818284.1 nucleotidyltransferase domain-containing protein [Actinomycetes bacterium]
MRIKQPLDDLFSNPNNVRILRRLVLYPSPVITGRGLAREMGMSHATCIRALNNLVDIGIVTRRTVGRSSTYDILSDSVIYKAILGPAFKFEAGLLDSLVVTLLKGIKGKVLAIYLFGSVARGEDTPYSDVDILLVLRDPWEKTQVEKALNRNREAAYRLFRVGVNAITYNKSEFDRMKEKDHPLMAEIIREGVLLSGKGIL